MLQEAVCVNPTQMFTFSGPHAKRILQLAFPVMLAMMSQTVINQVDHIIVGHLPNAADRTAAQTAAQFSLILLWFFGGFVAAIAVGTQSLVARRFSEGNLSAAGQVAFNSMLLALSASLVMAAFAWFLAPKLFPLLDNDPRVVALGVPFVRWRFLHIPSMVLFVGIKAFFDAQGRTRVAMIVAILMNIVNLLLCVGLVFGQHPPQELLLVPTIHQWLMRATGGHLPEMGMNGAGIAACISSYFGLALIFLATWGKKSDLFHIYRLKNFSGDLIKQIAKLSFPSGGATLFAMVGFGVVLKIVGLTDKLAGHAKGNTVFTTATSNIINILQLVFVTCIAYGSTTATLVSQSLGAKRPQDAETYARTASTIGTSVFALIGLWLFLEAEPILRFWNHTALDVLAIGVPLLRMVSFVVPLVAIALVYTQALYGAGNTRYVMIAEVILHFVCLMPLCYVLAIWLKLSVWGAWIALMVYIVSLAIAMYAKFRTGTWKQIQI